MFTKTKQWTLLWASFIEYTHYTCRIPTLILFFPKSKHVLSINVFYTKYLTPFCSVSSLPRPCCCLTAVVLSNKHNIVARVRVQWEPKSLCTWAAVALHCADSGEVPHMKHCRRHRWPQSRGTNTYTLHINLSSPGLFLLILAHPVCKMWIIQEPNTLELWNKQNFEEEKKRRVYTVASVTRYQHLHTPH